MPTPASLSPQINRPRRNSKAAILAALRERKRKAGTADRPLFLFGGAKVEKPHALRHGHAVHLENPQMNCVRKSPPFSKCRIPSLGASPRQDLNDGGAGGSLDAVKGSFIESTIGRSVRAHRRRPLIPSSKPLAMIWSVGLILIQPAHHAEPARRDALGHGW